MLENSPLSFYNGIKQVSYDKREMATKVDLGVEVNQCFCFSVMPKAQRNALSVKNLLENC